MCNILMEHQCDIFLWNVSMFIFLRNICMLYSYGAAECLCANGASVCYVLMEPQCGIFKWRISVLIFLWSINLFIF